MDIDRARARTKEIDVEQRKLHKIMVPLQILFIVTALGSILSRNNFLPDFLANEFLITGLQIVVFPRILWVAIKGWKLGRERDAMLAKYGIW